MSTTETKSALLQKGAAIEASDNARNWGTFSSVGTAYNELIANFTPTGSKEVVTVVVPADLKDLALIALQDKMTVLASFNGPLKPYAAITAMAIYN